MGRNNFFLSREDVSCMQASRKIKITLFFLILVPSGFVVIYLDDWRSSRQLAIARRALQDRDADKALNAAREAARLTPNNGEVHFTMARVFRRQGQLDKVHDSLERAAKLGVTRDRIRREEWLAMAQAGQMKEARPHLSELLINPGDDGPEICEAFVNGYFLAYQLADAFQILDAWEKDYPSDAQPHVFRAASSSRMASWAAAATHFRKAFELAPKRIDIHVNLAATLLMMREMDEAAKLFEQALRSQPNNPEALLGWAQVLLERGQNDQARTTVDRILRSDPNNFVALWILGEIHSSAEQYLEAIQLLEKAVAIKSNDTKARYALGSALQRVGRTVEAQQHFEFVLKSNEVGQRLQKLLGKVRDDDKDVESRFEIAELLRETGEPRERFLWLRSIVELEPKHKAAHAELAKCYAALGNLEESSKHSQLAESQ